MMSNDQRLVSIITPTYNSERFIEHTIASVQAQEYTEYEHIVIDDCSNDKTIELIEGKASQDDRIILIKQSENLGAGAARNAGIKIAKGRYLAFLDADDYWHPKKLLLQLQLMREKKIPMVYSQYYIVKGEINVPRYKINSPKTTTYKKMLRNDYMGFLTVVYDTSVVGKMYMPTIRRRQDWAYKLKILKKIDFAVGIQTPLAYYRTGNSSLSSNKLRLIKYNFMVYHKELGNSFIVSLFLMGVFLIHYFYFKLTSKKEVKSDSALF